MMFTDVTKMVIDLTNQLSPILVGLNVALVVSAAAVFAPTVLDTWSGSLGTVLPQRACSPSTARSWRANRLCCSAINPAAGAPRSRPMIEPERIVQRPAQRVELDDEPLDAEDS